MSLFTPAPRELTRQLRRQFTRLRVQRRRLDLAAAETELGLLGWQQADFDAETQRQVNEIQDVERQQGIITNEAASLGLEIRRLQEEHAAARRQHEEARRPLDGEQRKTREPYETLQRQLAEKRKGEPNFQSRIPELDRELREVTRQYSELLTQQPQTPQIRQELQRLRGRTVAIPNEKAEVRMQHLRIATEIHELEEQMVHASEALREVEEKVRLLDESWRQRDETFTSQIAGAQASKTKVEKHIDELETAKANPYQRIGQVLADNNLAPVNQPQALEKVKQLRFGVGELEQAILESLAASAAEDGTALRKSYLVWAMTIIVVLVLLAIWW